MSFNSESVLEELDVFDASESKDHDLTPVLEDYLKRIAKTGNIVFPWCRLKPLLKRKINQVLVDFCRTCPIDTIPSLPNTEPFNYEALKNNILEAVESFESAPFTIQRVCELLTKPRKHYYGTDKYMRGLEKNLRVVTTVNPKPVDAVEDDTTKNQPAMVNGISTDTMNEHGYEHCASNDLQPVNGTGTVLENFATVFPSAPHISNQPNNIQVAIVSGADTYQATQSISTTFSYCTDSGDEGFHDASEPPMTAYDANGTSYCESETGEKYIVIEELNVPELNCETEDGGFEDSSTSESPVNQCSTPCTNNMSSENVADDSVNEKEEQQEPDRKRMKFEIDPENYESNSNIAEENDCPNSQVDMVTEDSQTSLSDTCLPCAEKEINVPASDVESVADDSAVKTEEAE